MIDEFIYELIVDVDVEVVLEMEGRTIELTGEVVKLTRAEDVSGWVSVSG